MAQKIQVTTEQIEVFMKTIKQSVVDNLISITRDIEKTYHQACRDLLASVEVVSQQEEKKVEDSVNSPTVSADNNQKKEKKTKKKKERKNVSKKAKKAKKSILFIEPENSVSETQQTDDDSQDTVIVEGSQETVIVEDNSDTDSVCSTDSKKERKTRAVPEHKHRCCALVWNGGVGHCRCTRPRQEGEEHQGLCKKHLAQFNLSNEIRHVSVAGKRLGTYLGLHTDVETGNVLPRPSGYHRNHGSDLVLDFAWKDADDATKKIYKECRNIRKESAKIITKLFGKKSKMIPESMNDETREKTKKSLQKELNKGYDSKIIQFLSKFPRDFSESSQELRQNMFDFMNNLCGSV